MYKKVFVITISILLCNAAFITAFAQPPTWTIDLLGKDSAKRSEKFAERKLGSERMAEKKFNLYRRVVQNNFTHYNYVYNANNKINLVLERAKEAHQDDYSKLISYYPYSLENTASQKTELDSVILKATAGILLHDLRNDWVDNMYLLMGKAYFLKKDFDTAAATFQFINYNLFPRKKGEDGSRVVGSRDEIEGNRISIANKEKRNIFQKLTAQPPSRNDALVWMARTLIEQNELFDAASLISTLQNDPNLPERLQDDLNDIYGYWFYTQGMYDSAAVYLEKGLTSATDKHDYARSEFLVAQLYELTGQYDKASEYYNKASTHTTKALLDIHAQMNNAKMQRGKGLDEGVNNLLKLSKKDNFEAYRDVLFYSAADLAMQKPDTAQAVGLFKKSLKYNDDNIVYKNKAYLQLAEIAYTQKKYVEAYSMYDSLQTGDTVLAKQSEKIRLRKDALSKIVEKVVIIEREDSLQRIAIMDPAAREAFVKKIAKKLRKEKGIKEEDNSMMPTDLVSFEKDNSQPRDLFGNNNNSSEWYFYNASLKSKGFADFKKRWGQRTNTDNWRRKSATATKGKATPEDDNIGMMNMNPDDIDAPAKDVPTSLKPLNGNSNKNPGLTQDDLEQPEDISFEGLMANLPLSDDKLTASNILIAENLYALGKLFQQELEDFSEAINTYQQSLKRFPDSTYDGEIYFNLSYCYSKLGMADKAEEYKKLVKQQFAGGKADNLFNQLNAAKTGVKNKEATQRYEAIYTQFIEGKFEEAIADKRRADAVYGNSYWTPQLLYIEAVYHVKQKDDSAAIAVLKNIVNLHPKSALRPKAEKMIDVLGRRKEIEEYLTNLQITRLPEDSVIEVVPRLAMIRNDSNLIVSPVTYDTTSKRNAVVIKSDSLHAKLPVAAPLASGPYSLNLTAPHTVIMVLDKVDMTYINESKNALARFASDNFRGAGITVSKDTITKEYQLLVFSPFANADEALPFLIKIQKAAPEEISWMPANKYSFLLIDDDNLQRMKNTKDIKGYKELLSRKYPGIIK